jgi:hypothetical protein
MSNILKAVQPWAAFFFLEQNDSFSKSLSSRYALQSLLLACATAKDFYFYRGYLVCFRFQNNIHQNHSNQFTYQIILLTICKELFIYLNQIKYSCYHTYLPKREWLCMILSYIYTSYLSFYKKQNVTKITIFENQF